MGSLFRLFAGGSAQAADHVLGASFVQARSGTTPRTQAASALPAVAGTSLTSLAFRGVSSVALRLAARRRALVRA